MRVDPSGLDVCLESTNNPTVPFGLHQRVAVYDSSGRLVHGQSFGTNNPNTGLFTSERGSSGSGGTNKYTGEVYNKVIPKQTGPNLRGFGHEAMPFM